MTPKSYNPPDFYIFSVHFEKNGTKGLRTTTIRKSGGTIKKCKVHNSPKFQHLMPRICHTIASIR